MSSVYRKRKGEEARQAYDRSLKEPRLVGEMTPPVVVDAIPGDPDGLLPRRVLDAPIRIQIPAFRLESDPNPDGTIFETELKLQWRRESEEEFQTVRDTEILRNDGSINFPIGRTIEVEKHDGLEGKLMLRYFVILWDGNQDWSEEVPIRLDKTGPYLHLQDPDDIPPEVILTSNPITDATLDAEDGVECEIPDFDDPDKDRIVVAVGWADAPPKPSDPIDPVVTILLPPLRKVKVPRDRVEPLRSGTHYVSYVLVDPAGNVSKLSWVKEVPVALGALPTNLHPHTVPLAADGLINRDDADHEVTVDIPLYDNPEPEDNIFVEWGASKLSAFPVGEVPPSVFRIPVSWDRLKSQYDYTNPGVQTVSVGYRVERAPTVEFFPNPTTIDVDVDFSVTGPVDPADPDPSPVNPLLDKVTVYGDSGGINKLTDADFGRSATAKFKAPYPIVVGDIFTLYWKGVPVTETYAATGAERPGLTDIVINVTWDEIERGGSHPELPVMYVMSNPINFPNNDQESVTTKVGVNAIRVNLPEPSFPDMGSTPGPVLNCSHLRSVGGVVGYRIKVPPSSYLVPGDDITLRWRAFGADGTTPIDAVDKNSTFAIPDGAQTTGVDWFVEYDAHVLPTDPLVGTNRHAFVEVDYTIPVDGSGKDSIKLRKMVSIALGSAGATCDLDIVVPTP
ncbi:hypothetical protein SAMN03159488_03479 [Pseudomonas sp. NFIX10]|uniref:hypothetical protein n=1 Tax=unclassified Pseudomonas TaxID=196821 RepID=UPI0008F12E6D|nr:MULTISPECIES: hypothetical protein [unclassified Pseudomonas]SFB39430.1 hypothetical protein SAMN03159488_03479 [Pseudomonas sp. NFIX10]SFF13291.1 hypothetical protein SAMN03159367_03202 [Pseudomonas sp. NFACC06-1]